ncbi:Fcf1-domain-containing protein [Aspergillus cavernicola]|uniref:Fcf1-domain-containing protein n=1 Tax=Aspergillus cavernicola TaxID=176166 RepID=A0ABR4IFG4_9EURO
MGVAKKTKKFAQMKRTIKARDERVKKAPEQPKKSKPSEELTRHVEAAPTNMFFAANTALGPPYRVLVDTNFVSHAIRAKLDMLPAMMDLLYAKCIPTFTDCTIAELEKLGDKYRLALRVAKDPRWERVKCSHKGTYADDCLVDRVMKHRIYVVGTNDKELCRRLRKIPAAGVIGLSTALHLQNSLSASPKTNINILLVARDWPHTTSINYASPWAGAHYRPVPGTTPQSLREESQARRTYTHLKTESATPGSGVDRIEGIEHLEAPPAEYLDETNIARSYGYLDGFRYLDPVEMPVGVRWGVRYDTFVINSPVYCASMLRRFVLRGGLVKEYTLANPAEAFYLAPRVRTVVNCSGTGFGDEAAFIIRGQTCLVRNPCPATLTRQNNDGSWSFCIPRPLSGGTIIGGTKQPHNWDPNPSLETRQTLLRQAAKWFPFTPESGGEFDVIRDIVGRRPAREGGVRIEVEEVGEGEGDGKRIVHGYGVAGRGFETSWGVAEDVVALVRGSGGLPEKALL